MNKLVLFGLLAISLGLIGAFLSLVLLGAMIGSSLYRQPKLKSAPAIRNHTYREEPLVLT